VKGGRHRCRRARAPKGLVWKLLGEQCYKVSGRGTAAPGALSGLSPAAKRTGKLNFRKNRQSSGRNQRRENGQRKCRSTKPAIMLGTHSSLHDHMKRFRRMALMREPWEASQKKVTHPRRAGRTENAKKEKGRKRMRKNQRDKGWKRMEKNMEGQPGKK